MKNISLNEAPRELLELWDKVNRDYTVFTRNGRPVAYLFSAKQYDEEDLGYMTDPEFWKMIRARRQSDHGIPLEQVEAEIAERERSARQSGGRRSPRNGQKRKR